jgi:hypothetical protein
MCAARRLANSLLANVRNSLLHDLLLVGRLTVEDLVGDAGQVLGAGHQLAHSLGQSRVRADAAISFSMPHTLPAAACAVTFLLIFVRRAGDEGNQVVTRIPLSRYAR